MPLSFGDFGKGFVHVLDERSLDIVMNELDTISDFTKYLIDKEALYARGVLTMFSKGGEEDMLAFYLHQGREFPAEPDFLVFDDDLWDALTKKPEWARRKEADRVSYFWDSLIETLANDLQCGDLISGYPFTATSMTDVERVVRVMARENRFFRRVVASGLIEFLELSRTHKFRSRIIPSFSGINYVIRAHPRSDDREYRVAELAARCHVARGLNKEATTVIDLATEIPEPGKGYSLDTMLLYKPEWTSEDQKQMEYLQKELGILPSLASRGCAKTNTRGRDPERVSNVLCGQTSGCTGAGAVRFVSASSAVAPAR